MHKIILLIFIFVFPITAWSQSGGSIILRIGDHSISKDEFVSLYRKNNQNLLDDSEKKTPEEYLDLFINYKLKVIEAENLNLDTIQSFKTELEGYREELAKPYLTSVTYSEEMVETAYYRTINEVKASHILLKLNASAAPKDTFAVFSRIMDIRQQIMDGADFNDMAKTYSEDPSAKQNNGLLGYFHGFQMVYPFEDTSYKTRVGNVSMPIRSSFGYHLIKVHDKRAISGQIKVAHITKRFPSNAREETINLMKHEIDSVAELIKIGTDFADLARKFSDDKTSALNGGEMAWFSYSDMLEEFAKPAFALENDGDISKVIRTPYGWHIIKRIDYKPVTPLSEMRESLIEKIRRSSEISKHNNEVFIKNLKSTWNFDESGLPDFLIQAKLASSDGIISEEGLTTPQKTLFSYSDKTITYADFADYLKTQNIAVNANLEVEISSLYNQLIEQKLTEIENLHLEEKHPEFKYLMTEYHDGILLFNFSEKEIWNKASTDTLGLEKYYRKNKNLFSWEERFIGWVVQAHSLEVRDFIDKIFVEDDQIYMEELKDQLNLQFGNGTIIEKGAFEKGDNSIVDYLVWDEGKPLVFKDELFFLHGNKVAPTPKTLEEARGQYVSSYQSYLEQELIKTLRKKHKIKVDKKLIKTIEAI